MTPDYQREQREASISYRQIPQWMRSIEEKCVTRKVDTELAEVKDELRVLGEQQDVLKVQMRALNDRKVELLRKKYKGCSCCKEHNKRPTYSMFGPSFLCPTHCPCHTVGK